MKWIFLVLSLAFCRGMTAAAENPVSPEIPPSPPGGITPGAPQRQDPRNFIIRAFTNQPSAPTNYMPHWTNRPAWSNRPAWNPAQRGTNLIITNPPPWKGAWSASTNPPPWRGAGGAQTPNSPGFGFSPGGSQTTNPPPWKGPMPPDTNPPPWHGPISITNSASPSAS